jgi:hypothetical protein
MGVRFPLPAPSKYQYSLWNQRLAALVSALRFGCFRVGLHEGTSSGTSRIHCCFNTLAPAAADSISADYPYLRQITECAADLESVRLIDVSCDV